MTPDHAKTVDHPDKLLAACHRETLPSHIIPMTAFASPMPDKPDQYAFEYKWDGLRALLYFHASRLLLETRNLLDVTAQYPELAALARALASHRAVLDGEIVALDDHAHPSFELLQRRMHLTRPADIRQRMADAPVYYMIFDLLHLDGYSTRLLPYTDRRLLLDSLQLDGPHWTVPAFHAGQGTALLKATRNQGLEGIVAKRLDSPYRSTRSRDWLKIKLLLRQEFVIGGFTPAKGHDLRELGALLLGVYDPPTGRASAPAKLHFAGAVGTGFTHCQGRDMIALLTTMKRASSPFAQGRIRPDAIYVHPELVAEVAFAEWTSQGILRQPSFKGLREDKDPREVIREPVFVGLAT